MDYKKGWIKVDIEYVKSTGLPFGFLHPIKTTGLSELFEGNANYRVTPWTIYVKGAALEYNYDIKQTMRVNTLFSEIGCVVYVLYKDYCKLKDIL